MTRELLFDPVQLGRRAEEMTRATPVAELAALTDRLATSEGVVQWSLVGEPGLSDRPRFRLHLKADLQLTCQRCLNPMPWAVDETRVFAIYPDEESLPELEDEPEDVESLVATGDIDALALVTEEMLLALPMMALHDDESCHAETREEHEVAPTSPFAMLKQLKN